MDFSINLGKFSTINPSNTGLHLAYKFLPNHPVTPTYPHSIMFPLMVVSHALEACILYHVDHSGVSKQEPMAYMPQLSVQATSRSESFRMVYFGYFPYFIYIS